MQKSQPYPDALFTSPNGEGSFVLNPEQQPPESSKWFPECNVILEFAKKGASATSVAQAVQRETEQAINMVDQQVKQPGDTNLQSQKPVVTFDSPGLESSTSVQNQSVGNSGTNLEVQFAQKVHHAILTIRMAMRQFKRLAFSFNGGKDNTVVLYLIRAACLQAIKEEYSDYNDITPYELLRSRFTFFYIHNEVQIKQVMKFLCLVDNNYNLGTTVYAGNGFKNCIVNFCNDWHPDAVFMGVRSTDPNGKTTIFSHCSPTWPQFVRVCPILYWSYVDVWDFLKRFRIHYCTLYDQGYTSLGSAISTTKHPTLKDGGIMYRRFESMASEPQFANLCAPSVTEKRPLQRIRSIFTSKLSLSTHASSNIYARNDSSSGSFVLPASIGASISNSFSINSAPSQQFGPKTGQQSTRISEISENSESGESRGSVGNANESPASGMPKAAVEPTALSPESPSNTIKTLISSAKRIDNKLEKQSSSLRLNRLNSKYAESTLSLMSTTDEEPEPLLTSSPSHTCDILDTPTFKTMPGMVPTRAALTKQNLQKLCTEFPLPHDSLQNNNNRDRDKRLNAIHEPPCEDFSDTISLRSYIGRDNHKEAVSQPSTDSKGPTAYTGPRLVIDELIARGVPADLLPPQFDPSDGDGDIGDEVCSASAIFLPVSEGEDERINRKSA